MSIDRFMQAAILQAKLGLGEGGIPIGSVLVVDDVVLGKGRNRRVQRRSPILHAEMDALEDAGRLAASVYRKATLYTTLSPCDMCTGAILLFGIPHVVIGENQTFKGNEGLLRSRGVRLSILQLAELIEMMSLFQRQHAELWNEDIGN